MTTNRRIDRTARDEELAWVLKTGARIARDVLVGLFLGLVLFVLVWIADSGAVTAPEVVVEDCQQVPVGLVDQLC